MAHLPGALERYPDLDQWVRVDHAETVTVATGKVEIGQGITTALALIAAHELGVDVSRIRVRTAHTGITPNEFITAGSMSVEDSGTALRQACAHARALLLEAAAEELGMEAARLEIDDGWISGPGLNEGRSIWTLQGGRSFRHRMEERLDELPPGPPPARQERLDLRAKVLGRGVFLQDLVWPEMLHARVVRPPTFRHRLAALEDPPAPPGSDVRLIRDGSFLAVTGSDEYQVVRHAERVAARCRWRQASPLAGVALGTDSQAFPLEQGTPAMAPVPELDFEPALTATYTRPHIMHASLAPSAAAALWDGKALTVWSHSQGVELLKRTVAEALDLRSRQVTVIHHQGAGAYGHSGADDAALDAAICALACHHRPVLLKWTRTQEHRWEPYGPAMRMDLAAALDDHGRISRWSHEVWSYTHAGRPVPREEGSNLAAAWLRAEARPAPPPQPRLGPEMGIHRNAWPVYDLPAPRVIKRFVAPGPLRTSSLRSLGAHGNVFAIESFMDELAVLAGQPPVAFRLAHLGDHRARAVLEAVDELCGGVTGPRGVALARYKNRQTYAAVVAQVDVDPETAVVRVPSLWIAADAGRVVDPDGLINQLEGGAVQAVSWTLKERVRFGETDIDSEDWESYPVLRFDETPEVTTRLLDRPEARSLGAGEATQGPTAAAVVNAVYAACGLRVRDMPLDPDRLKQVAAR